MKNSINKPLGESDPTTYKNIDKVKKSSVPDHDGEVPGVKEDEKLFYDPWVTKK